MADQKYKVVMILTEEEMSLMGDTLETTDTGSIKLLTIGQDLHLLSGCQGCTNDIFVTKVIG